MGRCAFDGLRWDGKKQFKKRSRLRSIEVKMVNRAPRRSVVRRCERARRRSQTVVGKASLSEGEEHTDHFQGRLGRETLQVIIVAVCSESAPESRQISRRFSAWWSKQNTQLYLPMAVCPVKETVGPLNHTQVSSWASRRAST